MMHGLTTFFNGINTFLDVTRKVDKAAEAASKVYHTYQEGDPSKAKCANMGAQAVFCAAQTVDIVASLYGADAEWATKSVVVVTDFTQHVTDPLAKKGTLDSKDGIEIARNLAWRSSQASGAVLHSHIGHAKDTDFVCSHKEGIRVTSDILWGSSSLDQSISGIKKIGECIQKIRNKVGTGTNFTPQHVEFILNWEKATTVPDWITDIIPNFPKCAISGRPIRYLLSYTIPKK